MSAEEAQKCIDVAKQAINAMNWDKVNANYKLNLAGLEVPGEESEDA